MVQCHSGAYGGCNSRGEPIRKLYQWITNSLELAEALSKKMTPEQLAYCVPLIGKEVRNSARYPEKLCRAILKALKAEARKRWPQRFIRPNEVLYEEPMQDPAAWMDAINKTRRVFEMTSVRSINLPDTDPLYAEIANLVPWELTRVQIARTPAQRRLPRDILFTHRGAAIEYQDGQLAIEAESLDGMHFPKQRFSKGVSLAIFWFGYGEPKASPPPEEQPPKETPPQPQPDGSKPPAPAPSRPTETVTFKNCPADVPQEVCSAVKRLHLNLGHPTEKELLRLLAYQGAISKHMITAVKHLHCSSCSRNKPPLKPRPSAMPVANMGQFNDTIQSDVFYCRDVVGTNYAVLGIIDQSTLLHQACRLQDMSSNHTLEIFRNLWFKPYGFPGTIRTDPGTNYGLHFKQYVERRGIWLEIIPAEAHWRIGLIERRNSVLRDILERIIDAESIFNVNDFDQALDSAVFALNSMTYTHGRPPYMAVFGQIPRIGAGLLQDDTALICHPDQQGMVRPDILRAEAIKALADINTSQALRRALLRKTATTHAMDLQPGQNCAYWRWQVPNKRSTKKKGAWIVARFLSYDPDGKSAWLHSGTTTVHVALEQLRGAVGFEQWQPTREDQQVLKQAANNIRQDLWQEHATTAPALEEDTYEYHMDNLENTDIAAAGAGTTEETTVALPLAPPPATATSTEETKTRDEQPTTVQVQQQHMEQHLQQQHSTTTNLRLGDVHFHSYPTSPAQRQVTPLDYHTQRFGLTRSARSRTPTNRRLTPRGDVTTAFVTTPHDKVHLRPKFALEKAARPHAHVLPRYYTLKFAPLINCVFLHLPTLCCRSLLKTLLWQAKSEQGFWRGNWTT